MLKTRLIPCLQLLDDALVKTVKFKKHKYIGDPINTVRIFNELEVDELCFLDIRATKEKRGPNLEILRSISNECFMPLSYGGGVRSVKEAIEILSIGFEKIVFNTALFDKPEIITELSKITGLQSIIGSIDARRNIWGKYEVYSHDGSKKQKGSVTSWARRAEEIGVGEILITSMDNDGTWNGYDNELCKIVNNAVNLPVIGNGGAGSINHLVNLLETTDISALALGSMVVYQQKDMGVLINFPDYQELVNIGIR
jgi:imidazole glycerol-phosphate synthase subunit HisF